MLSVEGVFWGLMAYMAMCYKFVLMGISYELFPWPRRPCVPVCYEGREVTLGKLVLWGGSEEMGLKCLLAFRVCCAHIAL